MRTPGITLAYNFRVNTGGDASSFGTGDPPVFIGPMGRQGVYQANFVIPNIPAGITIPVCDGQRVLSNLTVTVSAPTSSDEVRLCVQP